MQNTALLENLIVGLPTVKDQHARTTPIYQILSRLVHQEIQQLFKDATLDTKAFGPFGKIAFPYFKMGATDSLNLFELDELILFSFYWVNRHRYRRVLDIGANIGLHSTVLSRCGYEVEVFEPDPVHFKQLKQILALNQATKVNAHCAAVSSKQGEAEFVRVLGNTTSSHLAGSKVPYGELERFLVPLFDIRELIRKADLIKMDVEGHEADILLATVGNDWDQVDALVEVGSEEKARLIFAHFTKEKVSLFAQKIGWQKVSQLSQMPTSYKEGSLFISRKPQMPWNE